MSPRCGSIALRLLTARFSSDDKRVWLSFFEETPRNVELTDEYLTEIEGLLRAVPKWSDLDNGHHQPGLLSRRSRLPVHVNITTQNYAEAS